MKFGLTALVLAGTLLPALGLGAQDQQDRRDRPLRSDYFPRRLDPEERHESGLYGTINYQFIIFEGLGGDIYEAGQMVQVEAGYYWEKSGIFAAVAAFVTPWGHAFNDDLNTGGPLGTFDAELDIFFAGVVGRFGNGSWPGWHFGVSGGGGVTLMEEEITFDNPGIPSRSNSETGICYRAGLFLERDLINNEDFGFLLSFTFDYYWTGIDDSQGDPIEFWTLGLRFVFTLRPGVRKGPEPRDDD